MQHQLGSSEGSISHQKDGEELHWESCEPSAFSPAIGIGRDRKRGSQCNSQHKGESAVYMLCRCIQVSSVRLLITLEPFERLYSSRGNSFHCFCCLGRQGRRERGRKRGRDMIQMLRWLLFTPLLFFISPSSSSLSSPRFLQRYV